MNTFTEEMLAKEYREWDAKQSSEPLVYEVVTWWLSKFKAYQSHLISEGEKAKLLEIAMNPSRLQQKIMYNKGITAYQAIIRDSEK